MSTPRWQTPVSDAEMDAGEGEVVASWIESYCRSTRTTVAGPAGSPMVLLPYQKAFLRRLYARASSGRRKHRWAMLGVPRKNGKSGLASSIALYALINEDPGGEILSAAADKEQARIVFAEARRMVESSPHLAKEIKIYRDALEHKADHSVYRVLSSEAYSKEGLSPTLVVYDELHAAPNRELFDVLQLAMGARVDPLLLITTTAGVRTDRTGEEAIAYQVFHHLQEVAEGVTADHQFYGEWWADDGPIADADADRRANPAYGLLVDPEDFESTKTRTPETEYLTKRRNLFVATAEHWFPAGVFEDLADDTIEVGQRPVVLGFDGSWSQDSTAVVACTADDAEHLFVVGLWNRPRDAEAHWHVPMYEVMDRLREACATYNVVEIAADPAFWRTQLEELATEGLPVVEFSQQTSHMVEATAGFQQAVIDRTLTHDGHPGLALHVRNSVVAPNRGGVKIQKEAKHSRRKIDAAVAAIMAFRRARYYAERPEPIRGVFV